MPQVPIWVCVLIAVLAAAVCGAVAFFAGVNHRKREAEAAIGSAEDEAKRIISNAIKTAAAKKKEAVLEGKDEIHRLRNESEREMNDPMTFSQTAIAGNRPFVASLISRIMRIA